ncbi:DUF6089 family protein [Pontibacter sp. SGAir0037]|uniref:DUF6089 family protein n=1 Tax=Pontibacter sp. SGAir0037 TaxID=2571030 RepID=UPI0010CD39C8|nr:DUF6089 family protein [Pontibacter sp. SGAir0037]QCR24294.1 hypothetical protein C1N53_19320 [Pontibacter sp. SGAir0037]
MKNIRALLLLLVLFILVNTLAEAQPRFSSRSKYGTVGFSMNAMNYFGDIVPDPDFTSFRSKSTRSNFTLDYTYRFAPRISGRAAFSWGTITGDDKKSASEAEIENEPRYTRNLSFKSNIAEFSAVAIIDLFENRFNYQRRPDFVPYGFVGIAVFHHNPKTYYESGSHPGLSEANDIPTGWYALQPLGTEGQYVEGVGMSAPYSLVQVAIPFGLGLRYKLDRQWDLKFEIGWRKTFTDYLDDVSSDSYISKADLLSGGGLNPKAAALLSDRSAEGLVEYEQDPSGTAYNHITGYGIPNRYRRGNASDKDWYIIAGLGVNYIISPKTRRKPKFR